MLTLCMIVKNEGENLKNCLSKVMDFVDEVIIVDTGSNDNTKAIAAEFTDKIYDFKWCNDFSEARNFSISKASNDLIFVLDADEFVTELHKASVDSFIKNNIYKTKIGRIQRINIMNDSNGNKKFVEKINRIFNKNHFHYKGIIHEQLVSFDGKPYETEILDITVEHIGYTEKVLDKTDKIKRNIDLLDIAIKNDDKDPYSYFQLGKSYYMLKDYKNSALYFEKALDFKLDFRLEYVEDLVETYGYSLINSGRYSDALILEDCFEGYLELPDFNFLMGLIYMNNAQFTKAVESFLKCTKSTVAKVEGITTYSSYYNIGVIYDILGIREKAVEYYSMCGNYEPAKKRLRAQLN